MFLMNTIKVAANSPILFPGLGLELDPNSRVFPHLEGLLGNIHWYGLIIGIGFLLAVVYANSRRKQFGVTEDQLISMLLWAVPLSIVCARIYYCVFNWDNFRDDPISCLYIWQGGIAIYGGVIGAVLGAVIYTRISHISFGALADLGGLGLLIGQCFGRWGNFMNREAFGEATDSFLRMGLKHTDGTWGYYHPTFLYESAWNLLGFVILHFLSKKRKYDGEVFTLYVAWYGLGRFFIEGLRTDSLYLFGTGIRVSQMVAILSFLLAMVFFCYKRFVQKASEKDLFVHRATSSEK